MILFLGSRCLNFKSFHSHCSSSCRLAKVLIKDGNSISAQSRLSEWSRSSGTGSVCSIWRCSCNLTPLGWRKIVIIIKWLVFLAFVFIITKCFSILILQLIKMAVFYIELFVQSIVCNLYFFYFHEIRSVSSHCYIKQRLRIDTTFLRRKWIIVIQLLVALWNAAVAMSWSCWTVSIIF